MGANGGQLNRTAAMMAANANKPRNFSEEIKNVPDLQVRPEHQTINLVVTHFLFHCE